jgi:WXG100 family type VII secretion target
MAGQIRITPDQMRQRANEVQRNGQDYDQTISNMGNLINGLLTEWEGQASQKFDQQFKDLKPSFDAMSQLFADLTQQLNSTAQALEQLDQDIASKFGVG